MSHAANDAKQEIGFASANNQPNTSNRAVQSLPVSPSKKTKANYDDPQYISPSSATFSALLSPDTFSRTDLLQYFIRETSKSKLPDWRIMELYNELRTRELANLIPESYMPYYRVLRSIIHIQVQLLHAKRFIRNIQNSANRSGIPPEIESLPELSASGLFSSDIFSDPNYPERLVSKLIQIPRNQVPKLITQLQNYKKNSWGSSGYISFAWKQYLWYATELALFLKKDYLVDDLKHDMAEIQFISAASHQSSINAQPNNDPNSQDTSTVD